MDFLKNLLGGSKESALILSVIAAASNFKALGLVGEAKTIVRILVPNVAEEAKLEVLIDAGMALETSGVAFYRAWQDVAPFLHPAVVALNPALATPAAPPAPHP